MNYFKNDDWVAIVDLKTFVSHGAKTNA